MDATVAALLGASFGAVTALASAVLTSAVTLRTERSRQKEARKSSRVQALRDRTAVAFAELFAVQHATEWIAWFAKHDPTAVDTELVESFDGEVHRAYPKLLGAIAAVAALDIRIYEELRLIMERLYAVEGSLAIELRQVGTNHAAAVQAAAQLLPASLDLVESLPRDLARIMEMAGEN